MKPGSLLKRLALATLLLLAGCATGLLPASPALESLGQVPAEGPEASSQEPRALLKTLLGCASPADFLAAQRGVDMPRLVEGLEAWSAVRLGAMGPVREEAAGPLNRQRTTFLLQSLERYGAANTEVLAWYVLDSSHDDDLREILFLLAQDKRLVELLEQLPSLGPALEARGLKPSAHAERDFQWSDVGRALDRAGQDALATSPMVNGARSTLMEFSALQAQLPPPYQRALEAVRQGQIEQQFSASTLTLGFTDHMTFGVPLGLYGLAESTAHGVQSLREGRYEKAVRELAPGALVVALYAGGRGAAWRSEVGGASGAGARVLGGWEVWEARTRGIQELARQVRGRLGEEGVGELAHWIQARREAGRFVAEGGMDAAVALHETRGDVGRAQAMMSRARPGGTGASEGVRPRAADETARPSVKQGRVPERPGSVASLVDEQTGLTPEVVEARLVWLERETEGPRLPPDVAVLERTRPALDAPPPGAEGTPRWGEYVAYRERRLGELREGVAKEGPLRWEAYERMWGGFSRGLAFERTMIQLLRADAELPRAQRRFLGDFDRPRVESYVGVWKPQSGLRFADLLVIEEGPSSSGVRRVETFSFKSRNLSGLQYKFLGVQVMADAREAVWKYGEALDVRRASLQPLLQSSEIPIMRVHLIYEKGTLLPTDVTDLKKIVLKTQLEFKGLEIDFQ